VGSRTGYRSAIERALRFVTEHLDEPITLADVAQAAHSGEFHFHRLFHAELGEPVGRYITRRRVLPSMITRGSGIIVNVSSILGSVPAPTTSNYSATKAALNAWTHALRGEVERFGVRLVVFVAPHTQTELGAAMQFDGVRSLPVEYTAQELCRAIDLAPRLYAASPVYRMLLRTAAYFPSFMERQMAGSVKRLLPPPS
jgi:short-subunit dehydrogenase